MATIRICDLCGKRLTEDNEEELYAVKKYSDKWSDWMPIDTHKACRKKLFDFAEDIMNTPTGGSSMQER